MVIPRSPEPESSPFDDLNDEQRREVEAFAKMLKVIIAALYSFQSIIMNANPALTNNLSAQLLQTSR